MADRDLKPHLRRLTRWATAIFGAWFAAHTLFVTIDGLRDAQAPADLAVVLGNTAQPDGTPSPRLRARLDRAIELHAGGAVRLILVSGGLGREGFEEADVMARYLEAAGVPRAAILVDRGGVDTRHTAVNAARMMRERGLGSAIVVSQFFHLTRCKLSLRRAGVEAASSTHARFFEVRDIYSLVREFFAFYTYLVRM